MSVNSPTDVRNSDWFDRWSTSLADAELTEASRMLDG